MKVLVLAVGKAKGPVGDAIAAYERRVERYFSFGATEVKEEPYRRDGDAGRVRDEEGKRLLAKVPAGVEIVALHETGTRWTSERLSRYLSDLALRAGPGAAFLVGGAYGLSDELLRRATHTVSLSEMTLTHEIARLVLTEQLYRAGTLQRGEPYHKGREG